MFKKLFIPIISSLTILALAGCNNSTPAVVTNAPPSIQPTDIGIPSITAISPTPTMIPSATAVPPTETEFPSITPIPPTETPTPIAIVPTIPTSNTIQHFPSGKEFTVTYIHMIDETVGWAIGGLENVGDHVLSTFDGGTTWTDLTPPEAEADSGDRKTATGYFQDAQTGWVIYTNVSGVNPSQPLVWRTHDAGLSWQASQPLDVTYPIMYYFPGNLQFINGETGWLLVHVGGGMFHDYIAIYRSQDGGMNWSTIQDPYNDISLIMSCSKTSMLFTDDTHGWLTGDCQGVASGVLLYKSNDGGTTWQEVTLPDPTGTPGLFSNFQAACGSYDPFFVNNDLGHLSVKCTFYKKQPTTYQYFVFTTQNGGSTWTSSPYPGESLYFFSDNTGWAIDNKIQHTSDGGLTWKPIKDVSWTAQMDFISEQIGWGVAKAGDVMALVKTDNGGARWSELNPVVGP
jgi:photosystem II stability/assembly factor-like uncharacterized protein